MQPTDGTVTEYVVRLLPQRAPRVGTPRPLYLISYDPGCGCPKTTAEPVGAKAFPDYERAHAWATKHRLAERWTVAIEPVVRPRTACPDCGESVIYAATEDGHIAPFDPEERTSGARKAITEQGAKRYAGKPGRGAPGHRRHECD